MIIFEHILRTNPDGSHPTVGISEELEGKYYMAKLSALINSSNMSVNADRGQDFGYRLQPEQQAIIELWEADNDMVDKVSQWSKVMVDDLTHVEFLGYLLHQQEKGKSAAVSDVSVRREAQSDYERRVEALKKAEKVEGVPNFKPPVKRGEATVEDFLDGSLTGDASGDKVEEAGDDTDAPVTSTPDTSAPAKSPTPKAKK